MKTTKALAPRVNPQVAPRERQMDHNTVSRPQRRKPGTFVAGQVETVEQFKALGGDVQHIPAGWGRAA